MKIQPKKEARPHVIAIEDARYSIDEQIRELAQTFLKSMLLLKKERNALAPISKLPPEILLDIFKLANCLEINHVLSMPPYDPRYPVTDLTWRSFIRIAHVCHTWREVFFGSPGLWSRIIFSSQKVAKEMVSRSETSPVLNLRLSEPSLPRKLFSKIVSPLFPEILDVSRLESFHLFLSRRRLDQIMKHLSGGSEARNMQTLYIAVAGVDFGIPYCVPAAFFSITMPHLHSLYIRSCDMPWDSLDAVTSAHSGFPELQALTLWDVSIHWPKLYRMLAGAPRLRHLDLRDSTRSQWTLIPRDDNADVVQLQSLSTCKIAARAVQCLHFQRQVSYPATGVNVHFCSNIDKSERNPDESPSTISALLGTCGISRNHHPTPSHTNLLIRGEIFSSNTAICVWDEPFNSDTGLLPINTKNYSNQPTTLQKAGARQKHGHGHMAWNSTRCGTQQQRQ